MARGGGSLYYTIPAEFHITDFQDPVLIGRVGIGRCVAAVINFVEGEFGSRHRSLGVNIIEIPDCHRPALSRVDRFIGKYSLWLQDDNAKGDKNDE